MKTHIAPLRLAMALAACAPAAPAFAWSGSGVAYAPLGEGYGYDAQDRRAIWPRVGAGTLQERWNRPVSYANARPDIGSWRPVEAIQEDYDEGRAYVRPIWRPAWGWRTR